jgi:serine/threonine protein kinase
MVLRTGSHLGPYEILSSLGAGGMGEVYKARDTRLDRIVALKILPDSLAADPQFRDRFDREARSISQLDRAIQDLAGHQELGTTQRYMHLSPGDSGGYSLAG